MNPLDPLAAEVRVRLDCPFCPNANLVVLRPDSIGNPRFRCAMCLEESSAILLLLNQLGAERVERINARIPFDFGD